MYINRTPTLLPEIQFRFNKVPEHVTAKEINFDI